MLRSTVNDRMPGATQTRPNHPRRALLRAAALALLLVAVAIFPNAWLPRSWRPLPRRSGRLAAEPVVLSVPASESHAAFGDLRLQMDRGACRVLLQSPAGSSSVLFEMGSGTMRLEVP